MASRRTSRTSRTGRRPSSARRALERCGWRTTLAFHENHVRDGSGRLVALETVWVAEAEHEHGAVVTVTAVDPHRLWPMLAKKISSC